MDKWQAQDALWNSFGWSAYDETVVPDDAVLPYITYEAVSGSIGGTMSVSASLWDRSHRWDVISKKANDIEKDINQEIKIDGGYLKVRKPESNFATRREDPDELIRHIVLTVEMEFITN